MKTKHFLLIIVSLLIVFTLSGCTEKNTKLPDEYYACGQDFDCIKINMEPCGCSFDSINKKYENSFKTSYAPPKCDLVFEMPPLGCPGSLEFNACKIPKCVDKKCKIEFSLECAKEKCTKTCKNIKNLMNNELSWRGVYNSTIEWSKGICLDRGDYYGKLDKYNTIDLSKTSDLPPLYDMPDWLNHDMLFDIPDWVCDVVHSPRQDIDNDPEKQCSEFSKTANHFIEVDEQCEIIKTI